MKLIRYNYGISIVKTIISPSKHHAVLFGLDGVIIKSASTQNVELYPPTIRFIKNLRKKNVKTALITPNKRALPVINATNIEKLFDAIIHDVSDAEKVLGIDSEHLVIIDSSIKGIEAGKKEGFAEVIGIGPQSLLDHGAHSVVKDLNEVPIIDDITTRQNALESLDEIKKLFERKKIALFLDFDGTLAHITEHASETTLGDDIRKTLKKLTSKYTVAIISGRDLEDVKERVNLDELYYSGCHGFDIAGPNDKHFTIDKAKKKSAYLEAAKIALQEEIPNIEGAWIEIKKFSIAIHYRQTPEKQEDALEKIIKKIHNTYREHLKLTRGKKIYELQPNIPWNKGKALHLLLKLLCLDTPDVLPIYIGDDVTDEDAFKALYDHGLAIAVQDSPHPTAAHYALKDPVEVHNFLNSLI